MAAISSSVKAVPCCWEIVLMLVVILVPPHPITHLCIVAVVAVDDFDLWGWRGRPWLLSPSIP